jgi:hypothetical protein
MTTDNKIDFETKYYIIMLVGAETKYYIIMLVGAITLITLCLSVLIGFPISQLWVFRGMTVEDRESFFNKLDATCLMHHLVHCGWKVLIFLHIRKNVILVVSATCRQMYILQLQYTLITLLIILRIAS